MSWADETAWCVIPGAELIWKRYQDDFIVYNTGSGNTHLLDLLSFEILQFIQARQPVTSCIRAHISESPYCPREGIGNGYVEDLLERFQQLGLVEAVQL